MLTNRFGRGMAAVVFLTASLTAGCASGYYVQLHSEREIPALATLLDSPAQAHPDSPAIGSSGAGRFAAGQDLHLAIEELGAPPAERVTILLHGLLSDRTIWRYLAGPLGSAQPLLMIDLLGCGDSDRPDPADLPPGGYSPSSQARYVLTALRDYYGDHRTPAHIAVVGHSYGGAVALRMLGDPALRGEFADVVSRIDRLVLLAPMDFAIGKADPRFRAITRLGKLDVTVARTFGLLREAVARVALDGAVDPATMPREYADRAITMLKERDRRRPLQAMIEQAVPYDLERMRPDWDGIEALVREYRNVDAPTLLVWGSRDETLPLAMGYKLQAQLPNARLRVLRDSMHSLPLERPEAAASLIRSFIASAGGDWLQLAELEPDEAVFTGTGGLPLPAEDVPLASSR